MARHIETKTTYSTLFIIAFILFYVGCGSKPTADLQTPVFIISVDTLRSDRLPAYGYDGVKTPAMDVLRKDGVLYEKAYAHTPLTLPSHASMFTGQLPFRHGVRGNMGYALSDEQTTLAEQFKAAGYRTGAVVSSMVLRKSTGIAAGFDFFEDNMPVSTDEKIGNYAQRPGGDSLLLAQEWLERSGDAPPFFFFHLYDPHAPYSPPEPFDKSYDGEIAYTDLVLNRFLGFLKEKGYYDRSLILLVSDHGEGLGDHGEKEHGMFLYREALQVPFILKLPGGQKAGKTVKKPVGLMDIAPTIAGLLGLPQGNWDGVSVLDDFPVRELYAESNFAQTHYGWHPQRSALDGSLHYIDGGEPQLFDLDKDPAEKKNLYGKEATPQTMVDLVRSGDQGQDQKVGISQEDKEMLASLGYTGSFSPSSDIHSLNATDFITLVEDVSEARALINREREVLARGKLREILKKYPSILDARLLMANLLLEDEEYEKAEFVLMEGLAQAPNHADLLISLAEVEMALEKYLEAVKVARRAMAQDPVRAGSILARPFYDQGYFDLAGWMAGAAADGGEENGFISFVLGRVASINGDVAASIQHLEKADALLTEEPTNDITISTLVFLAEGYMATNRAEEGVATLQRALKLNPTMGQTRAVLAEALFSLDRKDEAGAVLDEGLKRKPGDPAIMEALIGMAMGTGDRDKAWAHAQDFFAKKRHMAVDSLCTIFLATGAPDMAEKTAKHILETMPNAGPPYVVLGRVAHGQKDFQKAAEYFEKALDLMDEEEPEGPWVEQALFHLGDGAALQSNPQAASEYFKRAMNVNPASANVRVALTVLYAQVGQTDVAVNIMKNWLQYYPTPQNVQTAVQTLQKLGLTQEAEALRGMGR